MCHFKKYIMKEIISQEVIESFLHGEDPEEYIVGIEFDYVTSKIHKIIQDPVRGKLVKQDSFTPFLWVGDISGLNFSLTSCNEVMLSILIFAEFTCP